MSEINCFTKETLRDYLVGTATIDDSLLESHLSHCQSCKARLLEVEQEPDSFVVPLRGQSIDRLLQNPDLEKAIEASRALVQGSDADSPSTPSSNITMPQELGAYQLLAPLGRGGMGSVYLANHQKLNKRVAIKVLPRGILSDRDSIARFDREVLAAGQLDHPSIVRATDAGQWQGTSYLVMDYIRGLDLSRLVRAIGPLSIPDACEMIRQAALGLSYAHLQGMVHRDIKPSNLMLDEQGKVKILDFGLVQFDRWDSPQQELTTVGQLMGTLDYMAPEQAERSGAVDHRADLYSLGATLFRLLCGRAPLVATPNQSPLEKLRLLIHHQPPSLALFRPDAPAELVQCMASLLHSDPRSRPQNAAQVAQSLEPFCQGHDLTSLIAKVNTSTINAANQVIADPFRANCFEDVAIRSTGNIEESVDEQKKSMAAGHAGSKNGKGFSRFKWIAAGMLPVFVLSVLWSGYWIVLQTTTGQLVIESEVADIQVKILRDGKPAKELSIQPGTQASRLTVDRYEIVMATPSDQLVIENQTFVLKQGETVVARIRTKPANTDAAPPIASSPSNASITGSMPPALPEPKRGPTFEDRSLDEWIEVVRNERSSKTLLQALGALKTLSTPENEQRIHDVIFGELLARLAADAMATGDPVYFQDLHQVSTFSMAIQSWIGQNKDKQSLVKQFRACNADVQACLMHSVAKDRYETHYSPGTPDRVFTLIETACEQIENQSTPAPESLRFAVVRALWQMVNLEENRERCLPLLARAPSSEWMALSGLVNRIPIKIRPEYDAMIRTRATKILEDPSASRSEVLATFCQLQSIGFGSDPALRASLIAAWNRRLVLDRNLASEQVPLVTPGSNAALCNLKLIYPLALSPVGPLPFGSSEYPKKPESIQLNPLLLGIQLGWTLPEAELPKEGLREVASATQAKYEEVLQVQSRPMNRVAIHWPELKLSLIGSATKNQGSQGVGPGNDGEKPEEAWLNLSQPDAVGPYLCHVIAGMLLRDEVEIRKGEPWKPFEIPLPSPAAEKMREAFRKKFQPMNDWDFSPSTDWAQARGIPTGMGGGGSGPASSIDLNLDGCVTAPEFVAATIPNLNARSIFKSWDTDDNGVLEDAERTDAYGRELPEEIDLDHDGKVSLAEYSYYVYRQSIGEAVAFPVIEERWWVYCQRAIEKMDKNSDQRVTKDEWDASRGAFDKVDTNSDGYVTVLEYYQNRTQRSASTNQN